MHKNNKVRFWNGTKGQKKKELVKTFYCFVCVFLCIVLANWMDEHECLFVHIRRNDGQYMLAYATKNNKNISRETSPYAFQYWSGIWFIDRSSNGCYFLSFCTQNDQSVYSQEVILDYSARTNPCIMYINVMLNVGCVQSTRQFTTA